MKIDKEINLHAEAQVLHPIIVDCYEEYKLGRLSDYDLVGIYILLFMAIKRPKRWSGGKLSEPLQTQICQSIQLSAFSNVLAVLDGTYLARSLKIQPMSLGEVTVMDIFSQLRFNGMKANGDNYINCCMLNWACGKRPVCLLSYIPSPSEVLRQQARGDRVVTIFTSFDELCREHTSKLTYMEGMPEHSRDPLEFTVHDLKHMEHFMDPKTHDEQVGFFKCMLRLHAGRPMEFFSVRGHDLRLWQELEYVISDMNCYSTHLLRYLYAKLQQSCLRNLGAVAAAMQRLQPPDASMLPADDDSVFGAVWQDMLLGLGIAHSSTAFAAAMLLLEVSAMRLPALNEEQWECIRTYFKEQAVATPGAI